MYLFDFFIFLLIIDVLPYHRKQDIDQYGLSELSDEDLTRLGIVEPEIRTQIIERAKLIPAYDETAATILST